MEFMSKTTGEEKLNNKTNFKMAKFKNSISPAKTKPIDISTMTGKIQRRIR